MKKLVFTGDIMSSYVQNEAVYEKHHFYNFDDVFPNFKDALSGSFVCGNLETPICKANYTDGVASFNTPVELLASLKKAGFDLLTTANNHAMDRGKNGLLETIDNIEKTGFLHTGTYRDSEESNEILVHDFDGCSVSFLSFTYGTNSEVHSMLLSEEDTVLIDLLKRQAPPAQLVNTRHNFKSKIRSVIPSSLYAAYLKIRGVSDVYTGQLDNVPDEEINNPANAQYLNRCINKIRSAKSISDIVIVCCHIGGQYNSRIGEYTRQITQQLSNSGADYIICNHPHCILPYDTTPNGSIFYSLGNISFTPDFGYYVDNVVSECSILLTLHLSTESKKIESITYSVAIVQIDEDNISRTHLLYDLIQECSDENTKSALKEKMDNAVYRFTHKKPFTLQREYTLL